MRSSGIGALPRGDNPRHLGVHRGMSGAWDYSIFGPGQGVVALRRRDRHSFAIASVSGDDAACVVPSHSELVPFNPLATLRSACETAC